MSGAYPWLSFAATPLAETLHQVLRLHCFSDAETSPFAWTSSLSIETFGPLKGRPGDRAGVAYFYNMLNNDFQQIFSAITPLGDVHGGEIYYSAEITPAAHVTLDLQVIEPEIVAQDTAIVLGLRAKVAF